MQRYPYFDLWLHDNDAMGAQAYTDEGYRGLLERCGFEDVAFFPSLPAGMDLFPIVARKMG